MLDISVQTVTAATIAVARRFTVPSLFSVVFYLLAASRIYGNRIGDHIEGILYVILLYGFFWFISLKLFAESQGWTAKRYYAVGAAVFCVIAWRLYTAQDEFIPFVFLGAGLFLGIFIAPFLNWRPSSIQIWIFNHQLWLHLGFSILASIILFLGLAAIPASLDYLFGVTFFVSNFYYIWLAVPCLFLPFLAMAGIPEQFDIHEIIFPKSIRALLAYIVLPLLLVYAVILYGYAVKILIAWDLPKGGLAYIVLAFACTGIIAYLASYPLHRDQGVTGLFSRHFFKLLLAPLVLLAIGIGVRIQDYGITEGRYAILLSLVWLTLCAMVAHTKFSSETPKFIFASLVMLLLAASYGPISAANVTAWSQVGRLEALLEKNQMLVNGMIQTAAQAVSFEDRINISASIDYFIRSKRLDPIKPWFENIPNAQIRNGEQAFLASRILQDMGMKYVERHLRDQPGEYNDITFSSYSSPPINVAGYDYIADAGVAARGKFTRDILLGDGGLAQNLTVTFHPDDNIYSVAFQGTGERILLPLGHLITHAAMATTPGKAGKVLPLIMENESDGFAVRLIITNIHGKYEADIQKPTLSYLEAKLLVKKK